MSNNLYDLIIVGAGPAGISAAIYAGRAMLRTLILDSDNSGGQIGITSEVVNYPGILSISGAELTSNMEAQAKNFGVEIKSGKVASLNLAGTLKEVRTADGTVYSSVAVIIATGARPRTLGFPGEKEFTGRGIGYCATCDGEFFIGKDIFVIGGGFAAAQEAVFLTRYAKTVHIIVRESDFTCSPSIVEQIKAHDKIKVYYNSEIIEAGGDSVLRFAKFKNNKTGETWSYNVPEPSDIFGLFVFAGYEPINELVKDTVKLNDFGYIPTNEDMQTDVLGVYAAGDIRPKRLRQLATAISDGAIASTAAERYIGEIKSKHNIQVSSKSNATADESSKESFLDSDMVANLKPVLDKLVDPVTILVIGDTTKADFSAELKKFAEDFAKLSHKLSFEYYEKGENQGKENLLDVDLFPVLAFLDKDGNDSGLYFNGIPGGHEFNSFVLAVYNIAGPGQDVSEATLKRIQSFDKKTIQVGATLSCTMCPDVVQASQLIARHNPLVKAQMIDISQFPEFREEHNIMSVPAVVVNHGTVSFGRKDMDSMLELLE